ncbi:hypothetical protein [Streptomyces torulosus]|uniref:hypothetical protein n=1 Tax=Streptomyces torulosus TaxID=68276 RepID=UPI0006EB9E38|nr:hypothetical protein [Streptomyces torulosus]
MSKITFEELSVLTGEMLPERAVLSALGNVGGNDGAIVSNSCAIQQAQNPGGLVGALGLGQAAYQQQACAPTAVAF